MTNTQKELPVLFDTDAENALIVFTLTFPEKFEEVDLQPGDFYNRSNRLIWRTITNLHQDNIGIDFVTVCDDLQKADKLNEVGGDAYISGLFGATTSYEFEKLTEIVKRFAVKRKLKSIADETLRLAYSADVNHNELDNIRTSLENVQLDNHHRSADPWQGFNLAEAYQDRPPVEHVAGTMFALPSLNIVYGSPGTLKSLFLADLAICTAAGIDWLVPAPWHIGNLAQAIKTRQCNVMWLDFDNGKRRTDNRLAALAKARELPEDTPITYYSMPNPWLNATDKGSIGALSLRIKESDCKLIVIDNLGTVSGGADENSAEMIQVMSLFRQLAEETGAAIVLIHHQTKNRGVISRAGDSLRGHSSIEASLDMALMVEREELSDTISIKCPKARGADVNPFSAVFTYEDDQYGELITAKFWGTASEDMHSGIAIKREIKEALFGAVLNKADLSKAVKEVLTTVGINRIRDYIDRMVAAGDLHASGGSHAAERIYRLP